MRLFLRSFLLLFSILLIGEGVLYAFDGNGQKGHLVVRSSRADKDGHLEFKAVENSEEDYELGAPEKWFRSVYEFCLAQVDAFGRFNTKRALYPSTDLTAYSTPIYILHRVFRI